MTKMKIARIEFGPIVLANRIRVSNKRAESFVARTGFLNAFTVQ